MTTPIQDSESEYVGAFSEPMADKCRIAHGDIVEDLEPCDRDATHTVVERDTNGQLHEIVVCDSCGSPEDAAQTDYQEL